MRASVFASLDAGSQDLLPRWHHRSNQRMTNGIRGVHAKALVVGSGNYFRGDDGAGLAIASMMRLEQPTHVTILELKGDVSSLIDHLQGYEVAMVIDATQSGSPPGTIHRYDASTNPLPETRSTRSTHGISVGSDLELARIQLQLPKRVLVYGIEGK